VPVPLVFSTVPKFWMPWLGSAHQQVSSNLAGFDTVAGRRDINDGHG
jgi:hypothetical protein